jgi:hypothetical protein
MMHLQALLIILDDNYFRFLTGGGSMKGKMFTLINPLHTKRIFFI